MEFVKRSHLVQLEHEETYDKTNLLSRGQEVVWDQEPEPEEVGVDLLRPGELGAAEQRCLARQVSSIS